jgi:hypothetical protein
MKTQMLHSIVEIAGRSVFPEGQLPYEGGSSSFLRLPETSRRGQPMFDPVPVFGEQRNRPM